VKLNSFGSDAQEVDMKLKLTSALAAVTIGWTLGGGAAFAATEAVDANALPATYEKVESFSALGGLRDFDAIDERTLIVWRTPFHPYLVELAFPSLDLKFARAIGIDSQSSTVHARFDSVLIGGLRYPIDSIYKLTRDEARELRRRA
jgi:hypothetical protein